MGGRVLSDVKALQSAAAATGDGTVMSVSGYGTVGFQVSGTFVGTITFETTVDGANWVSLPVQNVASGVDSVTTTAAGAFVANVAGLSGVRARISAYTSGTITVSGRRLAMPGPTTVSVALDASGIDIGDVTLLAGEAHVGEVGTPGVSISQTPTVTAGAYSANDAVGGLLTFANAARVSTYGGVIKSVIMLDDAGQDAALELWLFNATFTAMADNAAWAPSEADLRKLVAVISSTDGTWRAAGTPSANVIEVSQRYDLAGTSLFGQLVTRGTPTFAATDDVTVIVALLQD